jgi:putative ABC transport system permease protein
MAFWRQLTRGIRVLLNRTAADRDIADEVEHYLDEAIASLEATGLSHEEARRAARLQLGSVTGVREQVREHGWEHAVDTTVTDVRHGIRRLRRRPLFAILGALTLALGVGASTAIFSAIYPVLLQPLPYPDADRVMMIWDRQNGTRMDVTFGTYRELIARSRSFESLAVMRPGQVTVTGPAEPERVDGQYVTANYFRVLGVPPALGRDFQESDDRPTGPIVCIISDGLWRRRFGGDPTIVGRQLVLQDIPVTVIGVMPREFENVLSPSAEIWSPLRYDTALPLNGREWGHHLRMVGRVTRGIPLQQARQELDTIAGTKLPEFPRPAWARLDAGFIAELLQDDLTGAVKPALFAVLGAVVLLLTIACVNVTNLLLARGVERHAEFAVRSALGASRPRLIRQLLTETVILAAFGGGLGIVLAHLAVNAVIAMSPPELPRVNAIEVDTVALTFALALTTLVGLAIGVVPALHGSGGVPSGGIQRTRVTSGHHPTRRALVIVQVALALVLLVGAGLLVRSLQQLFAVPPGFDTTNLLTMQVQTAGQRFRDPQATHRYFTQVLDAVREVPGVSAAAFTTQLPLTADEGAWGVHFETTPTAAADERPDGLRYAVSPGYFEAMGIPLRDGRVLNAHDIAGAPLAAVINESFARRRLPGVNPIGQRLRVGPNSGPWFTVVGVVGDVTQTSLAVRPADAVYMTAEQWHFADNARWLVVRAQRDAAALSPAIRHEIWAIDKDQPILRVATMDDRLRVSVADRRFALLLFGTFGVVALALAAIGTYCLLSGNVTERTRELGVRAALGASRRSILQLVLRQGMTLTGLGIVIGTVGAAVASQALVTMLFGISRLDFTTYLSVVALLTGVSAVACGVPAWRAARVPPSVALRSE